MANRPGLFDRFKLARKVFNSGLPGSRRDQKAAPYYFPHWRAGVPQWSMVDFDSYVSDGFERNALVYEAIMYKARCVLQTKAQAVFPQDDGTFETAPPDHLLNQLIQRPTPHQSWTEFQALQEVYLNISGNAYVLFDRPSMTSPPVAMYSMRPDRVWIIPKNTRELLGYVYVPEGKTIEEGTPLLPQDVSHVKFPNPGDPLEGMGYGQSPMASLSQSGDVDNALTAFINNYFESGTMISTYLTFKEAMDVDTLTNAKERFQEIYGGSQNWTEVGAFDAGGEVKRFGMTFNEMSFKELDERNEARIVGPFGVPLTLLASRLGMSGSTYNNKQLDREMFWDDTMIPEMQMFENDYRFYLVYEDGARIRFAYDTVPALQTRLTQKVIDWRNLVEYGITKNEAARVVNLPVEDMPDGDVIYLNVGLIPMGRSNGDRGRQSEPGATDDEETEEARLTILNLERKLLGRGNGGNEDSDPRNRNIGVIQAKDIKSIWTRIERIKRGYVRTFRNAAEYSFEKNRIELQAFLTGEKRRSLKQSSTADLNAFLIVVTNYLGERSAEMWAANFHQKFIELITAVGMVSAGLLKELISEVELAAVIRASQWLAEYEMVFAKAVNQTTINDITFLVDEAIMRGSSIPEVSKQLDTIFDVWMFNAAPDDPDYEWFLDRKPIHRRDLIARDQIMRASNGGTNQLHKAWGVTQRSWIATADDRVRLSHLETHGQIVDIDQPYTLGSGHKVGFPGDSSLGAPLSETIQCRCVSIPVRTVRGVLEGVGAEAISVGL